MREEVKERLRKVLEGGKKFWPPTCSALGRGEPKEKTDVDIA